MRAALSERSTSASRSSARRPFDPAAATTMQMHFSQSAAATALLGSAWHFARRGQTVVAELGQLSHHDDSITSDRAELSGLQLPSPAQLS